LILSRKIDPNQQAFARSKGKRKTASSSKQMHSIRNLRNPTKMTQTSVKMKADERFCEFSLLNLG